MASFKFNETSTLTVPFGGTANYSLGIAPPDNWTASEILYHRLTVDLNGGTYSYAGSGICGNGDIANFMTHLRLGNAAFPGALYGTDAPHITVKYPCYVVVDLRPNTNLRFMPGVPALKTVVDKSTAYCTLVHYTDDTYWTPAAVNAPSDPCKIISFAVVQPTAADNDLFNYSCLLDGMVPSQLNVDPAIKNRG